MSDDNGLDQVFPEATADEQPAEPTPTPEELLAETEPDDPEVGIDGTGLGELP
jgi:hypothetical protein